MADELRVRGRRGSGCGKAAAIAVALALPLSPGVAAAQQKAFYLDRLFMAGAPDDAIGTWRPQMGDKTRFFGQLGLGFGYEPFRVENMIKDPSKRSRFQDQPVKLQLITYADVGVELLDRFAFQVQMPAILGQATGKTIAVNSGATDAISASPAAVMDLRLDARAIFFRNENRSVKLGIEGAVWVPTGNATSYGGDSATSGGLSLAAEYDLKKMFFVLNTGPQIRGGGQVNDFVVRHEWRYSVGGFLPLRGGALRLGAQLFGSFGFGQGKGKNGAYYAPLTPFEWLAEGRYAFLPKRQAWVSVGGGTRLTSGYAPDFRIVALAGYWFGISDTDPNAPGRRFKKDRYAQHGADSDRDGIPDDMDLCPSDPEDHKPPNTDDGCPALPDRDGDGIPDVSDKCPDQAEDFDNIDDLDGCPEEDADKDGIPDAQDACPKEPGEPSPEPAKNGCPQFIRRITGSSEIQILKQVQFTTGRATILQNSFAILDEVVRLLKVNPEIVHLDIEGHTDNRGSDELNEKLSNERANSVMKYLVEHGIEAGRLSAAGFGPKRPIADNNTPGGRQTNRRVEFHIRSKADTKTEGGTAPPPP
jgi:outer membrane protein OmpA-like peptidoglycan-associated protein